VEWDDFGVHFNTKNARLEENSLYIYEKLAATDCARSK
jgi:hypothetical protein